MPYDFGRWVSYKCCDRIPPDHRRQDRWWYRYHQGIVARIGQRPEIRLNDNEANIPPRRGCRDFSPFMAKEMLTWLLLLSEAPGHGGDPRRVIVAVDGVKDRRGFGKNMLSATPSMAIASSHHPWLAPPGFGPKGFDFCSIL